MNSTRQDRFAKGIILILVCFVILFTSWPADSNASKLKIAVDKNVMKAVNSWNGKYVMLIHKGNPIKSVKDFKGRPIFVFYGYGLTQQNAFEFIKAIKFTTDDVEVAVQNNWDYYPKQFIENKNRVAFIAKLGADILLKKYNVQEIEFYTKYNSLDLTKVSVKASILEYNKLCDLSNLTEATNVPSAYQYSKGGKWTAQGCTDIETKFGHPHAVCITFLNNNDIDLEIPIESLKSFSLQSKSGKKLPAMAFLMASQNLFGTGYSYNFVTKMKGVLTIVIKPKEKADLIFLFQSASHGDILQFGKLIPITVQ